MTKNTWPCGRSEGQGLLLRPSELPTAHCPPSPRALSSQLSSKLERKMSGEERSIPIYTVDAFTGEPFAGNPAAVCLLDSESVLNDEERLKLGAEMNLSETSFVVPQNGGDFVNGSKFGLRWFTPTSEVDLCGHATLASAAVLFFDRGNKSERLEFASRSGPLYVTKSGNKMSLNFPLNPPSPRDQDDIKNLLKISVGDLGLIQDVQLSNTTRKLLIRLRDDVTREALEKLEPLIGQMVPTYNTGEIKGVGITIKGSRENGCVDRDGNVYDFVSRYFAPWLGIPEDPVTGSWHTVAGAYWAKELGKTEMYARQCSRRGGEMWLKVDPQRVTMSGQAVINLKGTFYL
ncbi:phenazine biosynthesis-like domain-containing protein 1 [Aplysia californica]|uniref:Phenazine biosynthesis-like domain-containing protein 1 n=1 Tax=Aplysia californica TaxID=6500 RepID=A0ABM0ZUI1_APLCA|nr:phenazine biosynthesis-like domain-containing protein 1 [Aplysia californica]